MKKAKSTLIICLIILLPTFLNLYRYRGNQHRYTQFLKIPKESWSEIVHQKGHDIYQWQRLDNQTWILNIPGHTLAIQADQEKIQAILKNLSTKIPLAKVCQNLLTDQELETYGLSSNLQTQIHLKNPQTTFTLILGHLTPSKEEIYILYNNIVYKSSLTFLNFS